MWHTTSVFPHTIKVLEANNLSFIQLKSIPDELRNLLRQIIDVVHMNPDLYILYNICSGNLQNSLTSHLEIIF